MTGSLRNLFVWAGVITVCAVLWLFTARVHLHFTNPLLFLSYVALAAAAITALLWWDMANRPDEDDETTL